MHKIDASLPNTINRNFTITYNKIYNIRRQDFELQTHSKSHHEFSSKTLNSKVGQSTTKQRCSGKKMWSVYLVSIPCQYTLSVYLVSISVMTYYYFVGIL